MADPLKEESGLGICTLWIYPGQAAKTASMSPSGRRLQQPHLRLIPGENRALRGAVRAPRHARRHDLVGCTQLGRHLRKLAPPEQRDIHELFTRSAGDLLDHWFETELHRATTTARIPADAHLTGMSREPIVEMLIPSTLDTTLAPKELTSPLFAVSIFPTNCRATATGIRNGSVPWTSSSRRWNRTHPTLAPASSVTRPQAQLAWRKNSAWPATTSFTVR